MNMTRRTFLGLLGVGVAAPYVIRIPGILMPVKQIWVPEPGHITATEVLARQKEHIATLQNAITDFTVYGVLAVMIEGNNRLGGYLRAHQLMTDDQLRRVLDGPKVSRAMAETMAVDLGLPGSQR